MPVVNGEYIKLTEEEIVREMEANLEELLGMTAEPGDLVTEQLRAEAETIAENIEESLQRVYEAAYLQDATGKELDKLVQIIGLERLAASPASGTARFSRATPPTTTYTVPSGASIQTGGTNAIEFITSEQSALYHIDGFEDSTINGWEGDLSSVSLVSTNNMTGLQALELPATSNVTVSTTKDYRIGKIFEADIRPQGSTNTGFQFGRQDADNYFEAVVHGVGNDLRFREVSGGSEQQLQTTNVTIDANDTVHLTVEWSLYGDHVATLYETRDKSTELAKLYLEDQGVPQWQTGSLALVSKDSNNTTLVDEVSNSGTTVNILGDENGVHTNVSADSIETLAEGLSGITNVTNPVPTGDPSFVDTDFSELVPGTERENDDELRERAFENTSIGGSATINSIKTEIRRVEGVQSLTMFQNKTENTVDGLPPHSFEAVVYGGDSSQIVSAIHGSTSIDSQDIGGAHGTEILEQIESDVMNTSVDYRFSRPTQLGLDITLDLVVDDTYIGDEKIRSRITNYIGGTDVNGSSKPGIDVGEDVYVSVLNRQIVNPSETGVWEVDTITIDKDDDGIDDIQEVASGADVVLVADSSVAETNARDGSITITKTQR
jgi:uncharacterized phage protein gp47/JayE